jgi:tetratricopeptide (TPR) repeat protein
MLLTAMLAHTPAVQATAPAGQAPVSAQSASSDRAGEAYFLFLQSRELEQRGQVESAIAALKKAIGVMPRAAELHAELAGVFAREGRPAESVAAAKDALSIDPANREANRWLGLVQAAVADLPANAGSAASLRTEAIGHLEKVLAAPVSDLQVQVTLGQLYAKSGQHDKAATTFKSVLQEQPGIPQALLGLGESAERAGRWEDAVAAWGQAASMGGATFAPRYATALVKLGDQYFAQKRYREAADVFDRALSSDRTAFDAVEVTRKRDRARELAGK